MLLCTEGLLQLIKVTGPYGNRMPYVYTLGTAVLSLHLFPAEDLASSQQQPWTVNDCLQMILVPNLKLQFYSLPN